MEDELEAAALQLARCANLNIEAARNLLREIQSLYQPITVELDPISRGNFLNPYQITATEET